MTSTPGSGSDSNSNSRGQKASCDGYVQAGLTGNRTIQFLLQNLIDMGCAPPEGFIQCLDCEGKPVSGGFGMLQEESADGGAPGAAGPGAGTTGTTPHTTKRPDCTRSREDLLDKFRRDREGSIRLRLKPEIYLCQENVTGPKHAQTILTHELIHSVDVCRAKVDPLRNCVQLACTEIRAENLSGECDASWEFLRGRLTSMLGHGRECVRRRAVDSVRANPNCTARAEDFVDAAMERCYADTFPFERHPNQR
jgi:Peptidase M76 family